MTVENNTFKFAFNNVTLH